MAEQVEFRFPSSQPYAYVGIKGTVEELANIDLEQLASLYANSLVGFRRYEQAAIDYMASELQRPAPKKPQAPASEPVEHKVGDKVTVGGTEFTKIAEPEDLIKELGATEIQDVNEPVKLKPWEKPKPKATGGTVVDVDFF